MATGSAWRRLRWLIVPVVVVPLVLSRRVAVAQS